MGVIKKRNGKIAKIIIKGMFASIISNLSLENSVGTKNNDKMKNKIYKPKMNQRVAVSENLLKKSAFLMMKYIRLICSTLFFALILWGLYNPIYSRLLQLKS